LSAGDVEITTGSTIARRVLADPTATVREHRRVDADPLLYPEL
jgi:hypothetical protein